MAEFVINLSYFPPNPAKMSQNSIGENSVRVNGTIAFLAIKEQQQVAFRIDQIGKAEFIGVRDLRPIDSTVIASE